MNKTTRFFLYLIIIVLPALGNEKIFTVATSSPIISYASTAIFTARNEFIHSFRAFAYQRLTTKIETTLPLPPWQIEAKIPLDSGVVYSGYPKFDVTLSRMVDNSAEIWTSGLTPSSSAWFIYRQNTKTWEIVLSGIDNTGLITGRLFVARDGTIWSSNWWSTNPGDLDLDPVPVLSRFNETTRHFEIPENVLKVPLITEARYYRALPVPVWPEIILDQQDIFWIFVHLDGVYRYDPVAGTVDKWVDIPDFPVAQVALSPDETIYFSKPGDKVGNPVSEYFSVQPETLFQFIPTTHEIMPVSSPDEMWPFFIGTLVDRSGNWWLGSTGYRDPDGNWHLIYANPEEYFAHAGEAVRTPPKLMIQSSDGRLWYNRYTDGIGEGIAWYNPETGDGCQFTDYSGTIIEDSKQQLWLVADGNLYRYSLKGD